VIVVTIVLLLQQKKLKIRVALEDLAVILVAGYVGYAVNHLVETGVFVFEGDLVFDKVLSFYLLQFHIIQWKKKLDLIVLIDEIELLDSHQLVVLVITLKLGALDIYLHPLLHLLIIIMIFIKVKSFETFNFIILSSLPIIGNDMTYLLLFHNKEVHDVWLLFVVLDMEDLLNLLFIVAYTYVGFSDFVLFCEVTT
jgi:hypothetical protein